MDSQHRFGRGFEDEVRRVGRLLWPSPFHQGALIVEGRERDLILETDDAVHVLEATTLRTKIKAQDDIEKTSRLVSQLRKKNPDKVVKGWFITRDELTADQQGVADQYKGTVTALPFKDFLAKLVDARSYLTFREKRPFGSVADPVTNHFSVPREDYVAPSFFSDNDNKSVGFGEFYEASVVNEARTVVLGDYGAGKSMALRELFFRASLDFYNGKSTRFPIYLNLRNHLGQASATEALIREASNTGYSRYDDLVKAWRADLIILILDGFDELITPAWTTKATQLREHRAACAQLVAEFIKESPKETPIVVGGRFSYFGSNIELKRAMRLPDRYTTYRLNDFTKAQAEELLKKLKIDTSLPDWLPSRPLLLGYFAAYAKRNVIDLSMSGIDPADGWDYLLDKICQRETEIQSGLYPEYVRRVLERIATKARYSSSLTAPISQTDIAAAFKEVFGREADDRSLGMLIRLPGLVAVDGPNEDRRFIDHDYADVLAGGGLDRLYK